MIKYFVFTAALFAASSALAQQKNSCTDCPAPYNAEYGSYYVTKEDREKRAAGQRIVDDFVKHGGTLNARSSSFDPLPKKDPAKEIAEAIQRQTDEQMIAASRHDWEMSKQTDALNRIDDSIKLQSLMDERPLY